MAKSSPFKFTDFAAFSRHMDSLGMFHMRLGCARMREAATRLRISSPAMPLAQVVGTNGKGSTAFFLSRLAVEHGFTTGLFTSPHFLTLRERIRLDGRLVSESQALDWANRVQGSCADLGLTYFETITLIAMVGFIRENVDLIVLEAGLGGRNDATSTWDPDVLLLTPIGLDHEHVIGPGLENIARDKAGAMKSGTRAISAQQPPEAWAVLRHEAGTRGAELISVHDVSGVPEDSDIQPALPGAHQRRNAQLALAGWATLSSIKSRPVQAAACRRALASTAWPGRLQRVSGPPEIILDGAHNLPALEALATALAELRIHPRALIFTCLGDKDLAGMAPIARALTTGPIFVPELPTYQRARPASEIARTFGEGAHAVRNAATALYMAEQSGGPVLVCGSLFLLAEMYALHPEWLNT